MTGSEHVKAGDEAIDQPLVLVAGPGVRGASSAIDSGFFIEVFIEGNGQAGGTRLSTLPTGHSPRSQVKKCVHSQGAPPPGGGGHI